MKRPTPRSALWAVAALAPIAAAAFAINVGGGSAAPAAVVAIRPSGPAPAFQLSGLIGGAPTDLAAAAHRPVLLSFFASWCPDCRQELTAMASLSRSAGAKVDVIGIDVNDTSSDARTLLAEHHISYPVGADTHGAVAAEYGLVGLPTTVFLDAGHQIVGRALGALTVSLGAKWIAALERPSV